MLTPQKFTKKQFIQRNYSNKRKIFNATRDLFMVKIAKTEFVLF